jgi:hypothetical protein
VRQKRLSHTFRQCKNKFLTFIQALQSEKRISSKKTSQFSPSGSPESAFAKIAHLGVLVVVVLLRPDPSRYHLVLNRVRQGEVVVPRGGHIPVFDQSVVEVSVERLLDRVDVVELGDSSDTDLLPSLAVRLRDGHVDFLWRPKR